MPDALTLAIQDDGRGFKPERYCGLGLLGIEERVHRFKEIVVHRFGRRERHAAFNCAADGVRF